MPAGTLKVFLHSPPPSEREDLVEVVCLVNTQNESFVNTMMGMQKASFSVDLGGGIGIGLDKGYCGVKEWPITSGFPSAAFPVCSYVPV